MKTFISFSGGVESTTMCLLYGKGATAIWCDTGDEEDEMYERIDLVEESLKAYHNGDFTLMRVYPKVIIKGKECATINEAALAWSFFPSPQARWCTSKFKIEPIDEFLSTQGDCELLIGFNADEEPDKDRTGNFMKCKNVTYRYPLYEDGHTREECEALLRDVGLHPNLPVYMSRGGCRKCFFKSKAELKAKYIFNRQGFEEDAAFEIQLQDRRTKFYHLNMNAGSYSDVRKEIESEIAQWGEEEVRKWYKNTQPHKPCGAFCHR